ncbi:HVO_A0114 family putative DNA-binding protein [Halorhabdus salina]|uniref:HVO_A0114 family putative DNA-binding protein n=1 Tax=Halorhabdus salina TaxID=2750670 RepID=UPI0015EECFC2|nr:transcriptional regulator [Halorhabdus salina]
MTAVIDVEINRADADTEKDVNLDNSQPILNSRSYAEPSRLRSPRNLKLRETITEHGPESIRATAEMVQRDDKQGHQNRSELDDIGIIEIDSGGAGKAKTPTLAYDELEIDIPFAGSNGNVGAATP